MSKISDSETSDRQVYGRLLGYVTPYWFAFLLSVLGYLLCSMSNVGFASLISYIVDSLGGNDRLADTQAADTIRLVFGSEGELNRKVVPVLIVAIVMLRGTGTFIGNYFIFRFPWLEVRTFDDNFQVHISFCSFSKNIL